MEEVDSSQNNVRQPNPSALIYRGVGSDKSIASGVVKTNNMGGTNDEFWKESSNDFSKMGYTKGNKNSSKILPISDNGKLAQTMSRPGSVQQQNRYNKEKARDPATLMAAKSYSNLQSLHNEEKNEKFSFLCTTADTILDSSNSHPSFRIYYGFLKRFMITMTIVCLLGIVNITYNGTSSWFESDDIKFGFEWLSLGNIDGMSYQSEGSYSTSIGKQNADKGLEITLAVDLIISIFLIIFFLYQIFISKIELRARFSPHNIKDYAVKVSITSKECPAPIEREIMKQFIRFGKTIEIIPITNYGEALKLELEIRKIGEKIGDQKAKDQVKNKNSQRKIDSLISKERHLNLRQSTIIGGMEKTNPANEFIVLFDKQDARRDCLKEFNQYSHWWSRPHKSMPVTLRLHGKYGYKVSDAPEPSDINLENWYCRRWIPWLIFIVTVICAIGVCVAALDFTIMNMQDKYDNIPLYTECTKYYFASVTASSYLSSSTLEGAEVSCYCRHVGYNNVKSSSGDDKTLCQYWLDYFQEFYLAFWIAIFTMLALNVFLTYFFKLIFNSSLFKTRYASTPKILTACCVFTFQFFFLGFIPEYIMDNDIYDLNRTWYLKAGPLYVIYFLCMLGLHPTESLIYWLYVTIHRNVYKKRATIQKRMNEVMVGRELEYSHKIGRLMAHAAITLHHGAGLPILYLFFFIHIALFLIIEKAMMLKFYRKMEIQTAYLRQYLIHVFLIILMFHFFRTIDVLGSEDIFPDSYSQDIALKSGTLLYYNKPTEQNYTGRIALGQGIGYLLLAILMTIHYILIWWAHRPNFLGKILGWSALLTKPRNSPIPVGALRQRHLAFEPATYKFNNMEKYEYALPAVDSSLNQGELGLQRPGSPENSNVDSHYDLKSEANSGENVYDKKDKSGVSNIYGRQDNSVQKGDNVYGAGRVNSEELEDI